MRRVLAKKPPIRPPIFKKALGSEQSPTDTIFVNHNDGSNTSMVDNELLAWMHEYKQCSAHYDQWFASKQMQIHCSLIEVAAVNILGHQATLSRQHRLEKQRR